MMQYAGDTRQERFISAVNSLKLRFPVREITDRTGYGKSTVSAYLKDREASEDFIRKFCESFKIDFDAVWSGHCPPEEEKPAPQSELVRELIQSQKEQIQSLKEQIQMMQRRLDLNSTDLSQYAQVNNALLKVLLVCTSQIRAKVEKKGIQEIDVEVHKLVAEHLEKTSLKGM